MSTYRVGLIGCGWISTAHMNGYKAVPSTQVVAASDKDPERLKLFQQEHGVDALYTDYQEMLDREDLDILSICTWPSLHCEMTISAAEKGLKAILCEKPLALGLSNARKMVEVCDEVGCKLIAAHQRRLEDRFVKAKELLDSGEIGELTKTEAYQGDLYTDDHGIDLMRFYAGDPEVRWILGQVDWQNHRDSIWGYPVEAATIAYMKFDNDVEGVLYCARAIEGHSGYSVTLTGSEGMIRVIGSNYPGASWIQLLNARTCGWQRFDIPQKLLGEPKAEMLGRPTIPYFWVDSWKKLVRSVVDSIGSPDDHLLSGRKAMKVIEIIAAVYESSRRRTMIEFPLPDDLDKPLELMQRSSN